MAQESDRRESLLESLQVENLGIIDKGGLSRRAQDWRTLAEALLLELHTIRTAIKSINDGYLEAQQTLFPDSARGLDALVTFGDKLINIYNESLATGIDEARRALNDGPEEQKSSLTIDVVELTKRTCEPAKDQMAYLVDMAKAEALDLMGEAGKGLTLVERYV